MPELSSAGGQLRLRLREGPWVRADPVQRSGDQHAPAGRRSLRKEVKGWAPSRLQPGGLSPAPPSFASLPPLLDGDMKQGGQPPLRVSVVWSTASSSSSCFRLASTRRAIAARILN